MLFDYLKLALGNIRKRKLRSWLTMIGIFIGIAAVVSLIGLGEGLRNAIMGQFSFLGTDIITVQAAGIMTGMPGSGTITPLKDSLADKISKVNGIQAAINRYLRSAPVEYNNKIVYGYIFSVAEGSDRKVMADALNMRAAQGRMLKDGDARGIVLGANFATDEIFDKPVSIGDSLLINNIKYEVLGILEKKGSFIIDNAIALNQKQYLKDFGDDGTVAVIMVKVYDPKEMSRIEEEVKRVLRKERDVKEGEEDFTVQTPKQTLDNLSSALFAVNLFVYIIASISLVVGGIGIMNTMYTAVLERTKEIGIMKAIGARNSTIFYLFSLESGFLGLVGGLIGISLGLILSYGFAFIGRIVLGAGLIQAHVSFMLIIGALSFSFFIGLIAGLIPAFQASRMQPVQALRYAK
jgi:putative ABC transport system permease protein